MSNLGFLPEDKQRDIIRTNTVLEPEKKNPWIGTRNVDKSATSVIWHNGPIGPFRYDFPEIVMMMESQGYQLMQNWLQGSATYLLQKIKVNNDIKVVWKLALSKKDGQVDGVSFVDANTGELYVLYLDNSKQQIDIDPTP